VRSVLKAGGILPYLPAVSLLRRQPLGPRWDYPLAPTTTSADPIAAITGTDAFAHLVRQIDETTFIGKSLLSPASRALLYAAIRATRPAHVVEIGTFHGGTAEVMARALYDNRHGTLHTVSPHERDQISTNL